MIESPRLWLRPHAAGDEPFMIALNSDPEVVRYTGDVAFGDPAEAAEVVAALAQQFVARRLGRLVVVERSTGERLGWCGFRWHEAQQGVDLGFRFFRERWGRGYATEAGAACLRWLEARGDIPYCFARAMPANLGSVRVLEKLGFTAVAGAMDAEGFLLFERSGAR